VILNARLTVNAKTNKCEWHNNTAEHVFIVQCLVQLHSWIVWGVSDILCTTLSLHLVSPPQQWTCDAATFCTTVLILDLQAHNPPILPSFLATIHLLILESRLPSILFQILRILIDYQHWVVVLWMSVLWLPPGPQKARSQHRCRVLSPSTRHFRAEITSTVSGLQIPPACVNLPRASYTSYLFLIITVYLNFNPRQVRPSSRATDQVLGSP
jgi:hypothetical protein